LASPSDPKGPGIERPYTYPPDFFDSVDKASKHIFKGNVVKREVQRMHDRLVDDTQSLNSIAKADPY